MPNNRIQKHLAKIKQWPAEWRELFAERAAIMQYLGNMDRVKAEFMAEEDIRHAEQASLGLK